MRLLDTGQVNKNDPNDARSVAIAALRATALPAIVVEDDTAVMKMWARRHRDLGSACTQTVYRLHAVLCDLVPGGFARRISVPQAIQLLDTITARTAADLARLELAHDLTTRAEPDDSSARAAFDAYMPNCGMSLVGRTAARHCCAVSDEEHDEHEGTNRRARSSRLDRATCSSG